PPRARRDPPAFPTRRSSDLIQLGGCILRHAPKGGHVAVVHRHDDIEAIQIFPGDLPGADALVGNPVTVQNFPSSPVRRFALVPAADSGGIDADFLLQPGLSHHLTKNGFGHRRTADVAQTDEQYGYHAPALLPRWCSRSL